MRKEGNPQSKLTSLARPVHKGIKEENILFANLCVMLVFPTSNRCVINKSVAGRGGEGEERKDVLEPVPHFTCGL